MPALRVAYRQQTLTPRACDTILLGRYRIIQWFWGGRPLSLGQLLQRPLACGAAFPIGHMDEATYLAQQRVLMREDAIRIGDLPQHLGKRSIMLSPGTMLGHLATGWM
jgi:hypothetical protein